jgi:preprotein translocase subunit SecE
MGVRIPPRLPDSIAETTREGKEFLRRVQQFYREVLAEIRRVAWPSRADVLSSTVVVVVVVFVLAFFLGAVDVGLSRIVETILR